MKISRGTFSNVQPLLFSPTYKFVTVFGIAFTEIFAGA